MPFPAKCTPEEFVRVWQESASASEVAAKLGIKPVTAFGRAKAYRKRGVPLKFHGGQGHCHGNDYAALAELARSLNGTH